MAEPPPKKPPVSASSKNEQIAALISTDDGALSRDGHGKIGTELRSMYDKPLDQGVPERFTQLLTELEGQAAAERSKPAAPITATSPTSNATESKPRPSVWGRLLTLLGLRRSP
jgi:Anti-sigma factor NepR